MEKIYKLFSGNGNRQQRTEFSERKKTNEVSSQIISAFCCKAVCGPRHDEGGPKQNAATSLSKKTELAFRKD